MPDPIQTTPPSGSVADTSVAQAQANAFYAVSNLVSQMNSGRTSDYMTQWASWKSLYLAGSADASTEPNPPLAYVVGYFNDPTTGPGSQGPYGDTVISWPFPALGTVPVTPKPPLPDKLAISPVGWFKADGGDVQNAPVGDTVPVGFIITAPDGSHWKKSMSATPFGVAYFYVKQ